MKSKTPMDYVELIDTQYAEAKGKRLSRMSVEWGKWSHVMNREVRKKFPHAIATDIFLYWQNRSQLLELHYATRFFKFFKKRRLAREGKVIRKRLEQISGSGDR